MSLLSIDLIIRIKNGYMSGKKNITGRASNLNVNILDILKKEGYVKDFVINEKSEGRELLIELLYKNGRPAIIDVKLYSKPGRKMYQKLKNLSPPRGGLGISVLSTSKGVMTSKEASKQKIGGELFFDIW